MKTILFLIALLLFSGFAPAEPEKVVISIPLLIAIITGVWEVIARLIPTVGHIGLIGKIIEILNVLSNFFNRTK